MTGSTVCQSHGGLAPQVRAKAQQRIKKEEAIRAAAELVVGWEGEVTGDPLESLLRMVQVAAMAERAYSILMQQEQNILTEVDYGKAGGLRLEPHPYLKLWNEERDRLAKMSKMALDAGVSERQVQIAEQQATYIVAAITAAIRSLGLTAEQETRALAKAAETLRLSEAA